MFNRSQKGIADIIIVALVALVAIPTIAFISLGQNNKANPNSPINNTNVSSPESVSGNLYLAPITLSLTQNSVFPVEVWADSKDQGIAFMKLSLSFDKSVLNVVKNIEINSEFKTVISQTTIQEANATGKITLAAGIPGGDFAKSPKGKTKLLTISFKGIGKGEASVIINRGGTQIAQTNAKALPIGDVIGKYKIN